MPSAKARSSSACAASSFSIEQNRVPEPKPMQDTVSPVLPRRRRGSELLAALDFSTLPSRTAAAVVLRNERRDQPVFMVPPIDRIQKVRPQLYRITLRRGPVLNSSVSLAHVYRIR